MLGARPIPEVVEHAWAFVHALASVPGGLVVDLGSGGGVPGLVVAHARPDLALVLVDRRERRTDHLRRLVRRLELDHRVTVRTADVAEGGLHDLHGTADAVVARGFGPLGSTLSAAGLLLRPGGIIVVSAPPPGTNLDRHVTPVANLEAMCSPDPRVLVFHRPPRPATTQPAARDGEPQRFT